MSEGRLCKVFKCIGTVYTCINSWKEPFNIYNSSIWIVSLFLLLNWFQACFQSDTFVVSRWQSPYCLCWLYKQSSSSYKRIKNAKQFIELWTNPKHTGDNALVQSKDTKTIYINSIRIILKYTANICFLEMGIFCCNSADGLHASGTQLSC
jgi:hypothetical protein